MTVSLPNVRKLFVPDPGYMLFEADLSGADGQVVAWEADDQELKGWLRDGVDMHVRHCAEVGEQPEILTMDKTTHSYYKLRQSYKHATHGVHYVGGAYAIAHHPSIGWSLAKAERYIQRYYLRRPGLLEWHRRLEHDLKTKRTITNKFGFRIIYFDRIEGLLPQAAAWVPQSTVALTCFKGALQLEKALPFVEIMLQVHDSIVFQVPFAHADRFAEIQSALAVPIPYPEPLTIRWSLSRSEKSWGDCEDIKTLV